MARHWPAMIATLVGLAAAAPTAAQTIVADLSEHLIKVTTGFAGTELLLFGAVDGDGEVIVVVRGPDEQAVVRRKARVAGVWVNRDEFAFAGVPAFYHVASSRPLDEIVASRERGRHRIGLDFLDLSRSDGRDDAGADEFKAALLRQRQRQGLYTNAESSIAFLGNRLFRADVAFPSNVPTGTYQVTVFLVGNGRIVSAQTTPLVVSKIGLGARITRFAHRQSALYGLVAIAFALFAGWLAGVAFRKT